MGNQPGGAGAPAKPGVPSKAVPLKVGARSPRAGETSIAQIKVLLKKYLPPGANSENITREHFHLAFGIAREVGLCQLQDAPLTNRLYTVLHSKHGRVSEDILAQTILLLYQGSTEERADLTFECFDLQNTGAVLREDLLQVYLESWLLAWRKVSEGLEYARAKREMPSAQDLANFANRSKEKLRQAIEREIDKCGSMGSVIQKVQFRNFLMADHHLVASVGPDQVKIATAFIGIVRKGGQTSVINSVPKAAFPNLA